MDIKGTKLPQAPENAKWLAAYKGAEKLVLVEMNQSCPTLAGDLPHGHSAIVPEVIAKKLGDNAKVIGPFTPEKKAGKPQDEDEEAGTGEDQPSKELAEAIATITDAEAAKAIYEEDLFPNKLVKEWATILKIDFSKTTPVKEIREKVYAAAAAKFN